MARAELDEKEIALGSQLSLLTISLKSVIEDTFIAALDENRNEAIQILAQQATFAQAKEVIDHLIRDAFVLQQPIVARDFEFLIGAAHIAERLSAIGQDAFVIAEYIVAINPYHAKLDVPEALLGIFHDIYPFFADAMRAFAWLLPALAKGQKPHALSLESRYRNLQQALAATGQFPLQRDLRISLLQWRMVTLLEDMINLAVSIIRIIDAQGML